MYNITYKIEDDPNNLAVTVLCDDDFIGMAQWLILEITSNDSEVFVTDTKEIANVEEDIATVIEYTLHALNVDSNYITIQDIVFPTNAVQQILKDLTIKRIFLNLNELSLNFSLDELLSVEEINMEDNLKLILGVK